MRKNIILIGSMGAGKTSIGKQLAKRMNIEFLDTDAYIVTKTGKSISELFSINGEEYFRELETKLLRELKNRKPPAVISTGGGMPVREENRKLLRELGNVYFLQAPKEILLKRLSGDTTRPLLADGDLDHKLEELLKKRTPVYTSCAHTIIMTEEKSIEVIVQEIISYEM